MKQGGFGVIEIVGDEADRFVNRGTNADRPALVAMTRERRCFERSVRIVLSPMGMGASHDSDDFA
jgi:hypothetical protein